MDPTGQPEWATQARHITRPEDVIINHDPEDLQRMERGELTTDIGSGTSSGVSNEKKGALNENGVTARTLGLQPGDGGPEFDKQEAEMPSGDQKSDDVIEWREGQDLIIEHKIVDEGEVRCHKYHSDRLPYCRCLLDRGRGHQACVQ